jgi:hypothetical protein
MHNCFVRCLTQNQIERDESDGRAADWRPGSARKASVNRNARLRRDYSVDVEERSGVEVEKEYMIFRLGSRPAAERSRQFISSSLTHLSTDS